MSIGIEYKKFGKSEEKIIIEDMNSQKQDKQEFNLIGLEVAQEMKSKISQSIKRPESSKKLEYAITVDYFSNGWGVGRISSLPIYWAAFNWGSGHLIGKRVPTGEFRPGNPEPNKSDFRKGRWHKSGRFSFIVKNPIPATNYIERTAEWLINRIRKFADRRK